jgi:hypothetical protein
MPPTRFEPLLPLSKRPQSHALERIQTKAKFFIRKTVTDSKFKGKVCRVRTPHRLWATYTALKTAWSWNTFSENIVLQSKSFTERFLLRSSRGHGIVHAVSRKLLTINDCIRSQVIRCGVHGGLSGTGTGFAPSHSVFSYPLHWPKCSMFIFINVQSKHR